MQDVLVVEAVIDIFPILAVFDKARSLEVPELMRHRGLFHRQRLAQMGHAQFPIMQRKAICEGVSGR